jgi:hypothetical protein
MLRRVRRAASVAAIAIVAGCTIGVQGLEEQGAPLAEDSGPAGDDAGPAKHPPSPGGGKDAGVKDSGGAPRPYDGGPMTSLHDAGTDACDGSSACDQPAIDVPAGWSLVAFATMQAASCPAGFDDVAPTDVIEGPTAAGACSCGACQITTAPTCASGVVNVTYDNANSAYAGTCNQVANPSPLSNSPAGTCLTDIYQGSYATYDVRYAAPAPSGGACNAPGVKNTGGITYAGRDRLCTVAASCSGAACGANLPAPYQACIAADGDVACPAGPWSAAHHVGTSTSFDCASCTCAVSATCSGTLTLYTDKTCTKSPYAVSTDVCVGISSSATFTAYKYAGAAPKNVACQVTGTPAMPDLALVGEQTICCTP